MFSNSNSGNEDKSSSLIFSLTSFVRLFFRSKLLQKIQTVNKLRGTKTDTVYI